MATVYLAHDLKHDRRVALKLLKPELAAVLGAERFVQEIRTTASLQHPHILPLFDSGTADGFLYYVMPYIQGETLRDRLNRDTQLGVDEAVRMTREIADALDYAHRHGIIHRDIKPENILLHDGRPMVADFGIALAVSAAAGGRMTETGLSLGTPHYMSPEQATAEKDLTPRADVYSLGSVLYEMLSGEPPHLGGSAQAIIMKIITDVARPVNELRKSVPAHVAAAVAKAIEKLPADRFESAKAFADALANPAFTTPAFTGATSIARAKPAPVLTRPFIGMSVVAGVAAIAAVWGWSRPAPVQAVSRFSVVLPDSQGLAEGSNGFRVALSPDGRTIVYVGPGLLPSSTRLWVRRVDQLRATPLIGTDGAINPSFAPGGTRVAFISTVPRAVRTVAIAGGPPITLTDSLVDLGGLSWGTDGYIYYDGHLKGDGLARIRETGGAPEIATMPDTMASGRYHMNPSALPDGRGVLFTAAVSGQGGAGFDVAVLDGRTRTTKILVHGSLARYAASGHLIYVADNGTMMAAPFDLGRLEMTGEAVAVVDGVSVRPGSRADVVISAGGLLVYAAGTGLGGDRELVWVTRTGVATAVDSGWVARLAGRPRLAPDGRSAAVSIARGSDRELWIKQLDRGPASKLSGDAYSPSWSPDGRSIIFASQAGVMRGPADGSALPTVFAMPTVRVTNPELTSDGRWIVFSLAGNLYAAAAGGDTARKVLVDGPEVDASGTLSPDGKWLAYASDGTGRLEVYVRPFPDTKSAIRPVSVTGGLLPQWSRDGRELFFIDERNDLIAAPVLTGSAFATGALKRLFSMTPYDRVFEVGLDGSRFLMTRAVGTADARPDELILVQNFFAELQARAPAKR
jgi:hypothetical protein